MEVTGLDEIRAVVEQLSARAQQVSFDQLGEIGEQSAAAFQKADAELQKSFVLECLRAGAAAGRMLRRRLPWRDEEEAELVRLSAGIPYEMSPVAAVLRLAEGRLEAPGMTDACGVLRSALVEWEMYAEARALIRRIDELLERARGVSKPELQALGPWTRNVYEEISRLPNQAAWTSVIQQATALAEAEPSRKWRDTSAALVAAIGREAFRAIVRRWLLMGPAAGEPGIQITPEEAGVQRGLLWFLPECADGELCGVIAGFAEQCLRKIPNHGAVSQIAGHACVHVLAAISGPEAVAQLSRLSRQVRYATARRLVEEAVASRPVANIVQPDKILAVGGGGEAQAGVVSIPRTRIVVAERQAHKGKAIGRGPRSGGEDLDFAGGRIHRAGFRGGVEKAQPAAAELFKTEVVIRSARHGLDPDNFLPDRHEVSHGETGG